MKLLFHIGAEKTGTTSLQNWCAANRKALKAQGVFYSKALGHRNHLKIYQASLGPTRDHPAFRRLGLGDVTSRNAFRDQVTRELAAEKAQAEAAGCHTFVLSNEHCHSQLNTQAEVDRSAEIVGPIFDEIEILCSVRPQVDMAVSRCSTAARAGFRIDRAYFESAAQLRHYFDFTRLAAFWSTAYGKEAVTLVPFKRFPDCIDVIKGRLGLSGAPGFTAPLRENEALDIRVIATLNLLRDTPDALPGPTRKALLDTPCFQRLQPGPELARAFQAQFDDANAALIESFAGLESGDLDPEWAKYDKPSNMDRLDVTGSENLSQLIGYILDLNQKKTTSAS
ncbi:hypothetical protein [Mesobacterium pallidum]|uniref:hypothetical protein n=1 Tax=Mesobacterium pallidum TaxID=2872037 RepID=UPI001EE35080|nr:hypothetical protein [Mesobacterium pallidum]